MPISNYRKLIFIHIPKNAGTAITNSVHCEFTDQGHHGVGHYQNQYPNQWKNYFKFAVVRNPWDRVVSNYEYARMDESYWHSSNSNTPHATHFDYHTLKNRSFEECVNLLYNDRHSLKHQGWGSQLFWITDKLNNIPIDKIFRYENLDHDQDFISVVPDLKKINLSPKSSESYKDYYKDDLINKVGEIYEEDIKKFNYNY